MVLHFAGITKESPECPVSSAPPAWERIQKSLRGLRSLHCWVSSAHPPPRSRKWRQSFVWGEWSRFTADGLPTKDHSTVTTGSESAAPTFTPYDLRTYFTWPLMQTQLMQSQSIHGVQWVTVRGLSTVTTEITSSRLACAFPRIFCTPFLLKGRMTCPELITC